MPRTNRKTGLREPEFEDVQAVCQAIAEQFNAKTRIITIFDYEGAVPDRALIKAQAYQIHEDKVWVLAEREAYWPNTQGTSYAVAVMMAFYRILHGLEAT